MPELSWDDEDFQSSTTKEQDWYQVVDNNRDIIRIVGKPFEVRKHAWQDGVKFRTAMCSMEQYKTCPYCELKQGDPRQATQKVYAATIFHILRTPTGAKPKYVGKLLAWRFGDDKKNQLLEHHAASGGKLNQIELQISLDKTNPDAKKYQKLIISKLDNPVVPKLPPATQKAIAEIIKNDRDKIKLKFLPKPEDLKRFLEKSQGATMEEATSFDPAEIDNITDSFAEPVVEEPKKSPGRPKKTAKKPEPKPEEELEEDLDSEEDLIKEPIDSLGDLFSAK